MFDTLYFSNSESERPLSKGKIKNLFGLMNQWEKYWEIILHRRPTFNDLTDDKVENKKSN